MTPEIGDVYETVDGLGDVRRWRVTGNIGVVSLRPEGDELTGQLWTLGYASFARRMRRAEVQTEAPKWLR